MIKILHPPMNHIKLGPNSISGVSELNELFNRSLEDISRMAATFKDIKESTGENYMNLSLGSYYKALSELYSRLYMGFTGEDPKDIPNISNVLSKYLS